MKHLLAHQYYQRKAFEHNLPQGTIPNKDQFDQIVNIAKDEGYIITPLQRIDPWEKDKEWQFCIVNINDAPCTNQEVIDHYIDNFGDYHDKVGKFSHDEVVFSNSGQIHTVSSPSSRDALYGRPLIEIAKNITLRLSNIYDDVKATKTIVHPSYFMDDMTHAEHQWGVRPYKGIQYTIINYNDTINEANQQERDEINLILNIASDEGYEVKYLTNGSQTISSPYVKIFANGDRKKFYQDMCNIYDRLYNLDYINTDWGTSHMTPAFFTACSDRMGSSVGYGYFDGAQEWGLTKHPRYRKEYDSFFAYLR